MNPKTTLKIFISSPGDYNRELRLTRKVVEALHGEVEELSAEMVFLDRYADDHLDTEHETGRGPVGVMISVIPRREIGMLALPEPGKTKTADLLGKVTEKFMEDALFKTSMLHEPSLDVWNTALRAVAKWQTTSMALSYLALRNSSRETVCPFHPSNWGDYFAGIGNHGYAVHFPAVDRYHTQFGSVFFGQAIPGYDKDRDERDESGRTGWNPLQIETGIRPDENTPRFVWYPIDGISAGYPQLLETDEYPPFIDAVFHPDPFYSLWEAAEELEEFDFHDDSELDFTVEACQNTLSPREGNSLSADGEFIEEELDPVEATLGSVAAIGSGQLAINRNLKAEISKAEKALLAAGVDKLLADASSTEPSPRIVAENY